MKIETLKKVLSLHDKGHTQNDIAVAVGVCRRTVGRMLEQHRYNSAVRREGVLQSLYARHFNSVVAEADEEMAVLRRMKDEWNQRSFQNMSDDKLQKMIIIAEKRRDERFLRCQVEKQAAARIYDGNDPEVLNLKDLEKTEPDQASYFGAEDPGIPATSEEQLAATLPKRAVASKPQPKGSVTETNAPVPTLSAPQATGKIVKADTLAIEDHNENEPRYARTAFSERQYDQECAKAA